MRVRDHIAISAAGAALVWPWAGRRALGLGVAGVLIDADHFAWYCMRQRRLSPVAALRFFNEAAPPQHAATRFLHSPLALLAAFALAIRRPRLQPVAVGMALHVALDTFHRARMTAMRSRARRRDEGSCRACGARTPDVGAHVWSQPWLLPSYRAENAVCLCARCHEAAHARRRG